MRVLLLSTYELGHQPLHVASPAAALQRAGHQVRALDLAVQPWDPELVAWAEAVACSVPMHTAMRLAVTAAERLRSERPDLPICFYGLYAPVAHDHIIGRLADHVIAGEYEAALAGWVASVAGDDPLDAEAAALIQLGHDDFAKPARDLLPGLEHYARAVIDGEERLAGYVEATHGCAHTCRHCPVPAVYGGRTRLVGQEVVMEDIDQLVAMGARHITFGDPDFLNAWRYALRLVLELHGRHPDLTFDVTAKVEHIWQHRYLWTTLRAAGCRFAVTAVESLNNDILGRLDKGHTRTGAIEAMHVLRDAGIEPRPSFLPFTPWTTVADVHDILAFVAACDLVENVDPVQYGIRLLLPDGSLLLDHPDLQPHLGPYDPAQLSWTWTAADPQVDELQREIAGIAERAAAQGEEPGETFGAIASAVFGRLDEPHPPLKMPPRPARKRPGLTESWFC